MIKYEWMKEFFEKLRGPEGCDFKEDDELTATWKCAAGNDKSKSVKILKKMGVSELDMVHFLCECHSYGGHCDCEIIFNALEAMNTHYSETSP